MSGCSLRWGYNYLDWLVSWEVDEYVSLDQSQKKQLNKNVDKFHQWHRETQLPLYVDFLQQLETQLLDEETDSAQLMQSFHRASDLWQSSLNEFVAFTPDLLRNLNDAQIDELITNTRHESDKTYEKYMGLDESEARAKQKRHMIKRTEKWLGALNDAQETMIDDWSLAVSSNHKLMLAARTQWQQQFTQTLQGERDSTQFDNKIQTLLVYPEKLWSPAYKASVSSNQQLTTQLFADLSHSLSRKQKVNLRKKLQGYIVDFDYLAKK